MPLDASDILRVRAAILDRDAFMSSPLVSRKPEFVLQHTARLQKHLSNPNCAAITLQFGTTQLIMSCNVGDRPVSLVHGNVTNWKLQPLDLTDAGAGGEYVESAHLRKASQHIDDDSMPYVWKKDFQVTYADRLMSLDCMQRRYQGVAVLTQMHHDDTAPDLCGWAVVLQIIDPGMKWCDFMHVLMNLDTGDVEMKCGWFWTPRWSKIKLLDFDDSIASEFTSGSTGCLAARCHESGIHHKSPSPSAPLPGEFALSNFLRQYNIHQEPPQSQPELMQVVEDLVGLVHKCSCSPERHCANAFLDQLRVGMNAFPEDSVVVAAQRLWTSPATVQCSGRELCSMINEGTRPSADADKARAAARVARAINAQLVTAEGSMRHLRPLQIKDGFTGMCWRGGGFPDEHKKFFDDHKGKKIRIPNFLATAFKDGHVVQQFLGNAHSNGVGCIKWQIELPKTSDKPEWKCAHVNYIENQAPDLQDESEFLFVPYSVFTIEEIIWSPDPTPANPHLIRMVAAMDNRREDDNLPVAPWS